MKRYELTINSCGQQFQVTGFIRETIMLERYQIIDICWLYHNGYSMEAIALRNKLPIESVIDAVSENYSNWRYNTGIFKNI